MDYIELTVSIEPFSVDASDILMSELGELGFESFTETDNGFNAYIPDSLYSTLAIKELIAAYKGQLIVGTKEKLIKAQNWNAVWESNFEPTVIANRCVIRAPFHTGLPEYEMDIVIEPKMSFGTGHHATTYLIAEWLLNQNVSGLSVLDMGCGTGVLAIIAALKNAVSVDAVDIDEWAYSNALENVAANSCKSKVTVRLGDASLLEGRMYNLILANINRNILVQDMERYVNSLVTDGTLVVSGIFTEDIPIVAGKAAEFGLQQVESKSRDKWARIVFQR